ncbi:hypothetical protein G7Y89_g8367 [Cudoniella acicularis]|uniref:Heterokaryon incompatibility domain-containing protein n=1 Tax=Cudoniella acicularis TaxID=354080 RepID=A0A8H4W2X7_9HELO|nr:hypothetical protein G7Y89_g8367 [Cudoniella acicularis]
MIGCRKRLTESKTANSSNQITGPSESVETTQSAFLQRLHKITHESQQRIATSLAEMEKMLFTETTIECTMETVSLKNFPLFVALSYTWGDPALNRAIRVNGQTVNVTTNLWDALLRVRKDEQFVTLWADAICIDQGNDLERSEQVCLMKSIYEKAVSVMVWLGPASNDSDNLMAAVNDVGKQALEAGILKAHGKDFQLIFNGPDDTILSSEQIAIKESVQRLSEKVGLNFPFQALKQFALRPYWTRVWIMQEIAVARKVTVFCGGQETSFSRLAGTILFLLTHSTALLPKLGMKDFMDPIKGPLIQDMMAVDSEGISQHIGIQRQYHLDTGEIGPGIPFFSLLTRTCLSHDYRLNQRATDPRDIIYGIVGMASDFEKLGFVPDYKKVTERVFTDATRSLLKLGYMGILAWSQQPDWCSRLPDLPTWVPDFTNPVLKPCYDEIHYDLFSASGKHRYTFRASPLISSNGPNILALSCFKVDKIQTLGEAWKGGNSDFAHITQYLDSVEQLSVIASKSRALRPGCVVIANWEEAPWRIPSGDQELHGSRYRGTEAMHRDFQELRTYLDALVPGKTGDLSKLSKSCNIYRLALGRQHNRLPFVSSMGYLGLVPAQSKKGDVICIVEGANSPFVFRSCGELYKLVGEAFVYGIMDGEFMASSPLMEIFHVC